MGVALVALVNHTYVAEIANSSNGRHPAVTSICVHDFSTTTQQDAEYNLTSPKIVVKKKVSLVENRNRFGIPILSSLFSVEKARKEQESKFQNDSDS
uniref:Uncharacterized protein n=1 Tax=Romanomermis culicivorax TaxID=13658 RepID=A0A915I068_ROMCU